MARPRKNEEKLEPTKNTQEEIEAALSRACCNQSPSQTQQQPTMVEKVFEKTETNAPKTNAPKGTDPDELTPPCELEIDAKDCFKVSSEHPDKSIQNYICGINTKIKNETVNGGYSTNVTLRIVPNQWVNVQHIVDWYRAKGFDVVVDEIKQPQYGMGAGSMEYNINISWVNAH